MYVSGITFNEFKIIVADIFKFPEICGEFNDESPDFIDRFRYVWHSKTAYNCVCVEYDTMKTHGKSWKISRRNCHGYGHTLAETLKDERENYVKNSLIVPIDVNFEEFKVIINSLWDNAEQIGRFKDFSHDRVSFHYQTHSYAKAVAYDEVDLKRWTVNLGRGCFGRGHTVTEALDNERAEALKLGHFTY